MLSALCHRARIHRGAARVEWQPGFSHSSYSMLLGNPCHEEPSEHHWPLSPARSRIINPTAPLLAYRRQIRGARRRKSPPPPRLTECESNVRNEYKSSWNMLVRLAVMASPSWALLLYLYKVKHCLPRLVCRLIGQRSASRERRLSRDLLLERVYSWGSVCTPRYHGRGCATDARL